MNSVTSKAGEQMKPTNSRIGSGTMSSNVPEKNKGTTMPFYHNDGPGSTRIEHNYGPILILTPSGGNPLANRLTENVNTDLDGLDHGRLKQQISTSQSTSDLAVKSSRSEDAKAILLNLVSSILYQFLIAPLLNPVVAVIVTCILVNGVISAPTVAVNNSMLDFRSAIYNQETNEYIRLPTLIAGEQYCVRISVKNTLNSEVEDIKLHPLKLPYWLMPSPNRVFFLDTRTTRKWQSLPGPNFLTSEGWDIGTLKPGEEIALQFLVTVNRDMTAPANWRTDVTSGLGEQSVTNIAYFTQPKK